MEFERLLLLWDDLDDLLGAARHQILNLVHGATGLSQDAAEGFSALMASSELPDGDALPEASNEA